MKDSLEPMTISGQTEVLGAGHSGTRTIEG